jgi:hypothetical protein
MERRPCFAALVPHVATLFKQICNEISVSARCGIIERAQTIIVFNVDERTCLDQEASHCKIASTGGEMEGRHSVDVASSDKRASSKKRCDHFLITLFCGFV